MRTSAKRQSSSPTDVITYRFNNKMMYVPPAENFDQAVTFARSAFESDLTGIDKSQISFSLNVLANGKQSSVGISSVAWSRMMSHLARYEIIDIHVQPEIKVSGPPPSYQPCGSTEDDEKQQHLSSHSSSAFHSFIPKRLFQRLSA
ncbi:hypothetical protein DFJ58DRAFT_154717 [Suillus subalutaceus]|uniref:uncharacterized protein n=1 Tax=Suillus subalutaceus TaxID=48586 RepID=UPI001B86238C|nr:uncharacterized protein DFJ58DRAFT_154717 [Suillus subalutaceus]KAG1865910.1 hypothetical protein DFJ58DRAFT_154717 [Suillus subalutaceus]